MMAINNPILSLKRLNDLESKIINSTENEHELEEIDFFISSAGGEKNFIKNTIIRNGMQDYLYYLNEKKVNNIDKRIQISRIKGAIKGALTFLKSYAIKNSFYL